MATTGTKKTTTPHTQDAGASQPAGTDWNYQATTDSSAVGHHSSRDTSAVGADGRPPGGGIGDELRQLVRDKTYEQIDSQKERATGTLGAVASAARNATQGLRDGGQPGLAGYVTRAADELDRWSSRLREQDLDDAVREVQEFARRKPAIFLGVAFGAGVLAARFFKSSGQAGSAYRGTRPQWNPPSSPSSTTYAEQPSVAHDTPDFRPDQSPSRGVI